MIIRFTVAACETIKVFVWGSSRLKTYERALGVGGTVVQCTISERFKQKKGNCCRCCLRDRIYSIASPRWLFCTRKIWRKGLIHPFLHIVLVQFILFFISSCCKIASAAINWINSAPQAVATTFAFSSVFILLLWQGLNPEATFF